VLVYLVGQCPDEAKELGMTTPAGYGIRHRPVLWEVGQDSATAALDELGQEKPTWGILFWIALMASAEDKVVVEGWQRLVRALPEDRDRADLIGIALVFAELAGRGQVWRPILEGWSMTESPIVNEWIAQAQEQSRLEEARDSTIRVL